MKKENWWKCVQFIHTSMIKAKRKDREEEQILRKG